MASVRRSDKEIWKLLKKKDLGSFSSAYWGARRPLSFLVERLLAIGPNVAIGSTTLDGERPLIGREISLTALRQQT